MRRTKIIATVGPATAAPDRLRVLLAAGADVLRFNFAHGAPAEHARVIETARDEARSVDRIVGILADLPGPKMRTGTIRGDEVDLHVGASLVLREGDAEGDGHAVSTTVKGLADFVNDGEEIFLADGEIVLVVTGTRDTEVDTEVVRGGTLRSRKGMHVPRAERKVQAFTPEDEQALEAALRMKVDLVGLSFVRDGGDLQRARAALPKRGHRPLLVAKIETRAAVENLAEVIEEADAVMVARGDLGIQMPLQEVPLLQKRIIEACNRAGKPVVTATQMLESMTRSPLPTRAEAADIANAVLDGTHALMLSEETAIGDYPIEAVTEMGHIALAAETSGDLPQIAPDREHMSDDRVSWAVAHAAVQAAEDLGVAAILCPTRSGSTPFRVAAFRPSMPVLGLSDRPETLGPLAFVWGVTPVKVETAPADLSAEEDVERAAAAALSAGLVARGDHVAVAAGSPGRRAGRTDFVRVIRVV